MIKNAPHLSISLQILATAILFICFQMYLVSLRAKDNHNQAAYAIEQMHQKRYLQKMAEAKKSSRHDSLP